MLCAAHYIARLWILFYGILRQTKAKKEAANEIKCSLGPWSLITTKEVFGFVVLCAYAFCLSSATYSKSSFKFVAFKLSPDDISAHNFHRRTCFGVDDLQRNGAQEGIQFCTILAFQINYNKEQRRCGWGESFVVKGFYRSIHEINIFFVSIHLSIFLEIFLVSFVFFSCFFFRP